MFMARNSVSGFRTIEYLRLPLKFFKQHVLRKDVISMKKVISIALMFVMLCAVMPAHVAEAEYEDTFNEIEEYEEERRTVSVYFELEEISDGVILPKFKTTSFYTGLVYLYIEIDCTAPGEETRTFNFHFTANDAGDVSLVETWFTGTSFYLPPGIEWTINSTSTSYLDYVNIEDIPGNETVYRDRLLQGWYPKDLTVDL